MLGVVAHTYNPALRRFGRRIFMNFEVSLGYISITRLIVYTANSIILSQKEKVEKGEKKCIYLFFT